MTTILEQAAAIVDADREKRNLESTPTRFGGESTF